MTIEDERAVLAGIMINNSILGEVEEIIKPWHFTKIQHRRIYETMVVLGKNDDPIDIITLIKAEDEIDEKILYELVDTLSTTAGVLRYAEKMKNEAEEGVRGFRHR